MRLLDWYGGCGTCPDSRRARSLNNLEPLDNVCGELVNFAHDTLERPVFLRTRGDAQAQSAHVNKRSRDRGSRQRHVAVNSNPRGQPQGPINDQDVEDFLYDALELLPGAADVEIRCEGGRATLTGSVQHKRVKRDVGEIAWAIPGLNDVQNNLTIASRRRTRTPGGREAETTSVSGRKQGA